MVVAETDIMKVKDLFEVAPLLVGRTEIDTVSKINQGLIWSCGGVAFRAKNPDVDDINYSLANDSGAIISNGTGIELGVSVNLPNGAVVTKVVVYGNISDVTWDLRRGLINTATSGESMATAVLNTEDTSIDNATIDNNTYFYFLNVLSLDAPDRIIGARITYTL